MDTALQCIILKPESETTKTEPGADSSDFFTSYIKVEPPEIKVETEIDVRDELPDKIFPETLMGECTGPENTEEILDPKSIIVCELGEGPSCSDVHSETAFHKPFIDFDHSGSGKLGMFSWPDNSTTTRFSLPSETENLINFGKLVGSKPSPSFNKQYGDAKHGVICQYCGKKLSRVPSLNRHIHTVHEKKSHYECELCGRKFNLQSVFKIHVRKAHKGEQQIKDENSEKTFGEKEKLPVNYNSFHLRKKPHECLTCGKEFSLKSNLDYHISAVHQKEKPFQCSQCEERFSLKNDMNIRIIQAHRLEKSLVCGYCMGKFVGKRLLSKHIREVHRKKQEYECKYCREKFVRMTTLKRRRNCRHKIGYDCVYCSNKIPDQSTDLNIQFGAGYSKKEELNVCGNCSKLIAQKHFF